MNPSTKFEVESIREINIESISYLNQRIKYLHYMKSPNPFFCGHDQSRFVEVDNTNNKFGCDACRIGISGKRLSCTSCGFNLHTFCSTAPESFSSLYVHPQHPLTLAGATPANLSCDLCSDAIKGMYYTCQINGRQCNFDLHPTCAGLIHKYPPVRVHTLDPTHSLELNHQPNGTREDCGGWAYRCGVCSVDVHTGCLVSSPAARPVPDTTSLIKMHPPVHVPTLDPTHLLEFKHHPDGTRFCDVCRKGCGEWAYRCGACSVDAHVGCLVSPAANQPAANDHQSGIRKRDIALHGIKLAVNVVGIISGVGQLLD